MRFDCKTPQEQIDLAGFPDARPVLETLQQTLRMRVMNSRRPWAGLSYLQPIGLGTPMLPGGQDSDLLESLPYK
ncbi:MAG TPA: hypothetical protein VMO17_12050 [Terriglobia bacterium]|nr:hypothetical protein [Terriglobia bacterium]